MRCVRCGSEVSAEDRFCGECGYQVATAVPEQAPEQVADLPANEAAASETDADATASLQVEGASADQSGSEGQETNQDEAASFDATAANGYADPTQAMPPVQADGTGPADITQVMPPVTAQPTVPAGASASVPAATSDQSAVHPAQQTQAMPAVQPADSDAPAAGAGVAAAAAAAVGAVAAGATSAVGTVGAAPAAGATAPSAAPMGQGAPVSYQAPQAAPYPAQTYSEGCLGAAWRDITSTPGKGGKLLRLILVGLIPLLNLSVAGYAVQWGRELVSKGERRCLPDEIVTDSSILTGLKIALVGFSAGVVMFAIGMILGLIPFVGGLISAVLNVVIGMLLLLAVTRMAAANNLAGAFKFKDLWGVMGRKPGSLFCAYFVPSLIASLIAGVIASILVFAVIAAGASVIMPALQDMASSGGYGYGYGLGYGLLNDAEMIISLIMGGIAAFAFLFLVIYVLFSIAGTMSSLVTYRAVAHWVTRYAPEWKDLECK